MTHAVARTALTILATAMASPPAMATTTTYCQPQGNGSRCYTPGERNPTVYITPDGNGGTREYRPGARNPTTYCTPQGHGIRCYTPGSR